MFIPKIRNYRSKSKAWKFGKALDMRKKPTREEARMWFYLGHRKTAILPWRRQHVALGYILDFYCPRALLAVELDGGYHVATKDAYRDQVFARIGIRTIRIGNSDFNANPKSAASECIDLAIERAFKFAIAAGTLDGKTNPCEVVLASAGAPESSDERSR